MFLFCFSIHCFRFHNKCLCLTTILLNTSPFPYSHQAQIHALIHSIFKNQPLSLISQKLPRWRHAEFAQSQSYSYYFSFQVCIIVFLSFSLILASYMTKCDGWVFVCMCTAMLCYHLSSQIPGFRLGTKSTGLFAFTRTRYFKMRWKVKISVNCRLIHRKNN